MKKVLLSVIGVFIFLFPALANEKANRHEYTGCYVFSIDNSEEILEIILQKDSTLMAFSSLGEVTLTYVKKDRFEFPQYGGVIIFERDDEQQIIACRISIAAIDLKEIKARKK
jgi:hypothetical protein